MKIIETNISINNNDKIKDFQSRVIEHESWKDYIEEIKNKKCIDHYGTMIGNSLPKESRIENLQYDDFHLNCDVYNYIDIKTKKLAFKISNDSIFI